MNKYMSVALCLMLMPASVYPMDDMSVESGDSNIRVYQSPSQNTFKKMCSWKNGFKALIFLGVMALLSTGFGYMLSGCGTLEHACNRMQDGCLRMEAACNAAQSNITDLFDTLKPKFENAENALELFEAMRAMSVEMVVECPEVASRWKDKLIALAITN